jgi:hypothetical protein
MIYTIEPVAAAIYTIGNGAEFAYELTYDLESCKGYKVRSVIMANGMIRLEAKGKKGWAASKPYIVKKNSKRQGDRVIAKVKAILAA